MQKDDGSAVGVTDFGISDIQNAGLDLLQCTERHVCPRLGRRPIRWCCVIRLGDCGPGHDELGGRDSHCRCAQKAAARMVDVFTHCSLGWNGSAECEGERFHARIEEFDLEQSISDGLW